MERKHGFSPALEPRWPRGMTKAVCTASSPAGLPALWSCPWLGTARSSERTIKCLGTTWTRSSHSCTVPYHRTALPPFVFLATPGTQTILDVHAHGVRFELFLRSPMKPARAPGRRALPGHLQGQGSKYCNITWPAASGRPHVSHRLRDALAPRSYARRLMRTCQLMHASVFTRNCARGE